MAIIKTNQSRSCSIFHSNMLRILNDFGSSAKTFTFERCNLSQSQYNLNQLHYTHRNVHETAVLKTRNEVCVTTAIVSSDKCLRLAKTPFNQQDDKPTFM